MQWGEVWRARGSPPEVEEGSSFSPSALQDLPCFYQPGWLRRCEQPNPRCSLLEAPVACQALFWAGSREAPGWGSSCYRGGGVWALGAPAEDHATSFLRVPEAGAGHRVPDRRLRQHQQHGVYPDAELREGCDEPVPETQGPGVPVGQGRCWGSRGGRWGSGGGRWGPWGGRWGSGGGRWGSRGGCWGFGGGRWGSGGGRCQPLLFSQFSLMQFSSTFWVHFTFKQFSQSSNPLRLLDSVTQLGGKTYTATAILRVT